MSRFFHNAVRSFTSFFGFVFDLTVDGLRFLCLTVRSRSALGAEVLFLRKQLAFYEERETQPRRLNNSARLSLVLWSQLFDWRSALVIVKPETLIGWHRSGFKLFWKWKSRVGRPRLPENIRKLIIRMALENPTWGQARVAAELSVKLRIYVSPRTVRAYQGRPHSSLGPGIPEPVEMCLPQQPPAHGRHFSARNCKVTARAILGGLHHEYRWERVAA
jgi:hypothetical protein